jgi:hypothetical protein
LKGVKRFQAVRPRACKKPPALDRRPHGVILGYARHPLLEGAGNVGNGGRREAPFISWTLGRAPDPGWLSEGESVRDVSARGGGTGAWTVVVRLRDRRGGRRVRNRVVIRVADDYEDHESILYTAVLCKTPVPPRLPPGLGIGWESPTCDLST